MTEGLSRLIARVPVTEWLVRQVARVPSTVHAKLLAAFLAMVALLITFGAVGLQVLSGVNNRAEELVKLQQQIAAYRELQHDATDRLYSMALSLMDLNNPNLDDALRTLKQFGDNLGRLQALAKEEEQLRGWVREEQVILTAIRKDYDQFMRVVTQVSDLVSRGKASEALGLQFTHIGPLTSSLKLRTDRLVDLASADMKARIEASRAAYATSRWMVIGFALGSIALALLLGYVISWSVIGPVRQMDARLRQIASGDFVQRVQVPNRDELGTLAANLNRMNDELGRLYQQLEAASRHKSEFLANMSHELRTPLNAILGYTELILDGIYGQVPEKVREVQERVQHSGRHLLGLINDVLDLSKIEAGQLTLALTDYSMKDVVQTVVTAMESLAAEKHLALRVSVPPDLPAGRGDERRIMQVLMNLVGNAVKFTEAGEVRIEASASNGQFHVSVADTGPGIAEADHQRIFEEFQQVDGASTRGKGGTGLGLAIAKRIVELHGGRIWVQSSPGGGSTFTFTVPVRVDRQMEAS